MAPSNTLAGRIGGVPLGLALVESNPLELLTGPPIDHSVDDLRDILEGRPIQRGGADLYPMLDEEALAAVLDGLTVETVAEAHLSDGRVKRTVVRLTPALTEVVLTEAAVDNALASGLVSMGKGQPDLVLKRSTA